MTRTRIALIIIGVAAGIVIVVLSLLALHTPRTAGAGSERSTFSSLSLACEGRVEGETDTTYVGAAADGIIKKVYVREGEQIARGSLLAEIACDDLEADLRQAYAVADGSRQSRLRLLRGSRDEQRKAAAQKTAAANATLTREQAQLARARKLFELGVMSHEQFDVVVRDYGVALADLGNAREEERLTDAPPLPEEVARADADVAAAEGHVQFDLRRLDKCKVRAPLNSTVLRVLTRPGESFSTVTPKPLFVVTDASGRRVRAEVDESDVGRISVGQMVLITADGFSNQQFRGTVERISPMMGRKTARSGDPAEKADRDVLETIIRMGGEAKRLPIGLRVVVQFQR